MAQGSRPDRVGEEIRKELAQLLLREVHDPGIGLVTLTRVKVSPDLQLARVSYTIIGDDKVFVVSFVANVLVAALIVYLGDQLGVGSQLSTGVVVVLGIRIFTNTAAIRRHLFHA